MDVNCFGEIVTSQAVLDNLAGHAKRIPICGPEGALSDMRGP